MKIRKKKVLFVCYGGGHSSIISLVAASLSSNPDIDVLILPLNGAIKPIKANFNENQVLTLSNFSYLFDTTIDKILNYGIMLLDDNYNDSLGITRLESIFYLGFSFYNLVLDIGYEEALNKYKEKKRQAFFPEKIMGLILSNIKPDIIITTTAPRFEFATIRAAKNLNIKSLQILDLFGDDFPIPSADHIVVMNEYVKNNLLNRGVKGSVIHTLGQPILEHSVNEVKKINSLDFKNKYGLNNRVLLFCPHKNIEFNDDLSVKGEYDSESIHQCTFEILNEISILLNLDIVVRPHPNDNIDNYSPFFEHKSNFYYFPNQSVFEAIAISDFALSFCSTVILQAIISGRLGFTFNQRPDLKYPWPGYTKKPFIYSSNYEDLKSNLIKYIFDSTLVENDNYFEKNSLSRINNLIMEIIE